MKNYPPRKKHIYIKPGKIFTSLVLLAGALAVLLQAEPATAQFQLQESPINYYTSPVNDPIAKLKRQIEAGTVTLKYDGEKGYLASLLEYLEVPVSSQMLVFSKTSFQRTRISPKTPRAIYFNDDVYVGYVQHGDVLELSAVDPQQGGVFYSLTQNPHGKPQIVRQIDRCVICHASTHTKGVPGHFIRSVYSNENGMPYFGAGTYRTDQSSPISQRWGGWYVSGLHGKQRHMGNVIANPDDPENLDVESGANITSLEKMFDTDRYLGQYSDIVALMVLEHQADMHNYITLANYQGRLALRDSDILNSLLDRPTSGFSRSTRRRFQNSAERVVKYMLFVEETKLTDKVQGASNFSKEFAALGPRDSKGRSLRDFDLNTRLFKYPCSYLIYSDSFQGLPSEVKSVVYRRLWEILTGHDKSATYAHLSESDRTAILEILRETKSGLPSYWNESKNSG